MLQLMYWPRGRVWGGSSSLNAMVYVRGHALDYDRCPGPPANIPWTLQVGEGGCWGLVLQPLPALLQEGPAPRAGGQ